MSLLHVMVEGRTPLFKMYIEAQTVNDKIIILQYL